MEDLAALPWVVTYHIPTAFTLAARHVRMLGVEPHIQVVVDSFLAVPFLVAGTSRVGLLQARLADRLARSAKVRVLPCPWQVVPIKEAFWWHPMMRHDPAHLWLRQTLHEVGRAIEAERSAT
jgi:DNA-binding transcriptional LysR family regulator